MKIDLWPFIMFKRALRHRDPMLRSPKKMLFVVVTLATVPVACGNS